MNAEKWRSVELTRATILDLVASHIYAMRGMDSREIANIDIPALLPDELITIKIKLKEA